MERLRREARSTEEEGGEEEPAVEADAEAGGGAAKPAVVVVKSKLPAGAVPTMMMPFGSGLPPSLLRKQREREERMEDLKREAARPASSDDGENDDGVVDDGGDPCPTSSSDVDFDEALLSRPVVKGGKRRPKTRG